MHSFKTLNCFYCNSVVLNLPEHEIKKLNGLSFQCECCGHQNVLSNSKFFKGAENDPLLNTMSFETMSLI